MKTNLLKSWLMLVMLLVGVGTTWGEDVVYKTALFGSSYNSQGVSSYSNSWTATNNGFTVNLANWNNNNNSWSYIKAGNKNTAYVGTITTAAAIDKAVTKIVVTIDAITAANVTSIKLYSGSAADACTTEVGSFDKSTGAKAVTITSPATNKFYLIAFDCIAKANGCVQVSKVEYYYDNTSGGGGSTPTNYTVTVANNIANGTVTANPTSAAADATVTLTATPASGYMLGSWSVTNASTSEAITVTDNKFTMPAANVNVNATFTAIPEKTIAEFIEAEGGKCYLTGTVSKITSTKYGNFDLTDESGTIYVYGCLTPAGVAQQFSTLGIVEGDKIKVLANEYELYNETNEVKNVIFVEEIEVEKPKYVVTIVAPENGTLVVKEGENVLTSGDEVEQGKVLTVECTPADGYRYQNWQYKEDGNWITNTSTMTRTVTQAISIRANFEAIPVYTVAWSVNGSIVQSDDLKEGAAVTAPEDPEAINGKVFTGWIETATVVGATPAYVIPSATAAKTVTYYAVFATQTGSAGGEVTEELTNDEVNSLSSSKALAYATEKTYTDGTIDYSIYAYTDNTNRKWIQIKKDKDVYVKMTAPETIKNVEVTLTAPTNSSGGINDITKHTAYSGTVALCAADCAYTTSSESVASTSTITNNVATLEPTGDNTELYLKVSTGARIWSISVTYGSNPTYSDYCTTVATSTNITISAAGWTTFYDSKHAYTMPEGLTGCVVTWNDEENSIDITEHYTTGKAVPAGEPLLLKGNAEVTYTLNYTTTENKTLKSDGDNILDGTDVEESTSSGDAELDAEYYFYGLSLNSSKDVNSVGFYWMKADGAPFDNGAHKAYLAIEKDKFKKLAKSFVFFDQDTEDAIKAIDAASTEQIYDLAGRRVSKATKGIFIVNGKKVIR